MLKTSSYIFSALLLVSVAGWAQNAKPDSVRERVRVTAIRVGADLIQPIKTFATNNFSGWEIVADAELKNYYPTIEIGSWQRDVMLNNGRYTNGGTYWRVGVDVNLLKKDPIKNMFFFGLRYGRSQYDESLNYTMETKEFRLVNQQLKNNNMTSGWLEMTTGLRVRVLKNFWMGYTGRIKFAASWAEEQQLQTYDVPGYGLTFKKPWWGFNYYLLYKIPTAGKR
jgi:hypothetical protein